MFPSCYSKPTSSKDLFKRTYLTKILLGVFVVYMSHTCCVIYGFVYTKPCERGKGDCISSYLAERPRLQLSIFSSLRPDHSELNLIIKIDDFDIHSKFERVVNVSLPLATRNNGTLHTLVYVHKFGVSPLQDNRQVHHVAQLSTYMMSRKNLSSAKEVLKKHAATAPRVVDRPISHWRSRLTLNMMSEDFTFNRGTLPSDVRRYMRVYFVSCFRFQDENRMVYLPLLHIDELSVRVKDMMEINGSTTKLPLTISYEGLSLRQFRLWIHMQDVMFSLKRFGFTEVNIDEIKGVLVDNNLYLLALTTLVTAFHFIFEFLAFKNDISFWRKKKNMVGMSRKTVLWRCFSTIVILLKMLEERSSLLGLIPVGIGTTIEVWKVKQVSKIQLQWRTSRSIVHVGKFDESERKTIQHDTQAMKCLSYLVYPLSISGAIFSLVYLRYKNYYSWLINSLVSGIYAFGFLSMAPQLFINFKLKSVGHLQWNVLMYKAVNTFVNDAFACVFSTHPSHQLGCFRDEILFLLYLYQRRLYSTNKTRCREYGSCHHNHRKLKAQ
ncbi:lipid scramblase CLPTM1L-like isoform X2 [Oncorhynchus nerka]|uniref:lipid scramblase CLPTM1L-like isoform X2 n=1 Tax=Oncorhynchus nerka TaxID=8023 RepID=UPI0031B897E7